MKPLNRNFVQAIALLALRPVVPSGWTLMLRACGVAALVALLVSVLAPSVSDLAAFFTIMLFACGPTSAFLPAASEPVLLAFGQFYSPLLLATIGSAAVFNVEFLNYKMFDSILHSGRLQKVRESSTTRLLTRWFDKLPFATVATAALTPIPFWIARTCAVLSRYSFPRYMSATVLGRFLRLYLICAIGSTLSASPEVILLAAGFAILALGGIAFIRKRRQQHNRVSLSLRTDTVPLPGGRHAY
ncbi:MAG: VTT domain-containing protein [Gemmatimonadota bacterium]|nr:MAG: VTT domain-containing protein [Gemmatimonadota bacterium]